MTPRTADETRINELRRIFQKLYPNATLAEISTFYLWLQDNHRDLLPHPKEGDSYQQLSAELQGLWGRQPPSAVKAKSKPKPSR